MKRGEESSQNAHKDNRYRRVRALLFSLAAFALAILILSACLFVSGYGKLRAAIQGERTDYVGEISGQIITSRQLMKSEYSKVVANCVGILNHTRPTTLADARECLVGRVGDEILLMTAMGEISDLSGRQFFLADRRVLSNLPESAEVAQLFTSLNHADDYWLFTARLNPITLDGVEYIAAILAVPADAFRDSLAISLFDGVGASYIIDNSGSVMVGPEDANLAFGGYNLLSSMLQAGAAEADIRRFQESLRGDDEGSMLLSVGGADWLLNHSAIDAESSIVVAIPLAVTAAATYEGLSDTILSATVSVLSMAGIAVLFVLFFFYRDRRRSRETMAAAVKTDFLAKMSHDIRTPLSAIIGLETLAADSTEDSKIKETLRQSTSTAQYLLSIINDTLDMTGFEGGKFTLLQEPFSMDELLSEIRSVAGHMAEEKRLTFRIRAEAPFGAFLGDAVRVKQILMNLLSNAIKFTPEGGNVALDVSRKSHADGHDRVTMIVSDDGIGMSRGFLPRVFLPFEQEQSSYTQQYAGSGLGLSVAKGLVDMMDGTIHADSEPGLGSTFTVVLPLARVDAPTTPEPAPLSTYAGRRVLLAEDNAINQKVAVALLTKKFGLLVDVTADGAQALERFAESEEGGYDLLIMDVKMPVMDGLEATRRIRALFRDDAKTIPIIALSANTFEADVALSLAAGMNAHLGKPLDIDAFEQVLHTYL